MRLDGLVPKFKGKVERLLHNLKGRGFIFVPYFTVRDPYDQARLWRRSRTTREVRSATEILRLNGASFLAHALDVVGPQLTGPWATNALPGLSWHQWGEAVDFYLDDGEGGADWFSDEGYEALAKEAKNLLLVSGYFWTTPDKNHIQYRVGKPTDGMSIKEVSLEMEKRFG